MGGNGTIRTQDVDGLAVHTLGAGGPLLLMPYAHAFTTCSMIESPLASMLAGLGRLVVSFDPPGAYASSRAPRMDVAEMVECATEALDACGVVEPVDVVGHSLGAFCATVFASERPGRVARLVLVSPTGVGDPSKLRALPFGPADRRFWRFYRLALPVYGGRGTRGQHKQVYDILVPALHADPSLAPPMKVDSDSASDPAPPRAALIKGVPAVKNGYLSAIQAPVHLIVGDADPIVPLSLAEKVCALLPDADLSVIDGCGHYPQHEAPAELQAALAATIG